MKEGSKEEEEEECWINEGKSGFLALLCHGPVSAGAGGGGGRGGGGASVFV